MSTCGGRVTKNVAYEELRRHSHEHNNAIFPERLLDKIVL